MTDNSLSIEDVQKKIAKNRFGENLQEVTSESHPELSATIDKIVDGMNEAFQEQKIDKPSVYLGDSQEFKTGINKIDGEHVVVVTEGVVNSPNMEAVLAHELGHTQHHNVKNAAPDHHIDENASTVEKIYSTIRHEVAGNILKDSQREYDADYRSAKTIGVEKAIEGVRQLDDNLSPLEKKLDVLPSTHPATSDRISALETLRDSGKTAHEEFVRDKTHLEYDHESLNSERHGLKGASFSRKHEATEQVDSSQERAVQSSIEEREREVKQREKDVAEREAAAKEAEDKNKENQPEQEGVGSPKSKLGQIVDAFKEEYDTIKLLNMSASEQKEYYANMSAEERAACEARMTEGTKVVK